MVGYLDRARRSRGHGDHAGRRRRRRDGSRGTCDACRRHPGPESEPCARKDRAAVPRLLSRFSDCQLVTDLAAGGALVRGSVNTAFLCDLRPRGWSGR